MSETPKPVLPPQVRAAIDRVKAIVNALPKAARILVVSTGAVAIVIGAWLALRSAYEPYAVLFSQIDHEDAGAIVEKLKELKVPYRIGEGGASIEVPEAKVHEARFELASAGLPRGGGVGFEGFDKLRLGATEFEQRVMYRRAMEGELARTIGSVEAVQSARVHLVLPEKSVFAAHRDQASASVIVRLRPGRMLGSSEIGGIVHLVSAAVPGLTPERVALISTDGTTLHRPRSQAADGDDTQTERQDGLSEARSVELSLEERARQMLERTLGPGHVDVRASADLDLARLERTEDHYDPTRTILRSEESSIERNAGGTNDTVAGVPGAESNLPSEKPGETAKADAKPAPSGSAAVGPAAPPPALPSGVVRETHTRNFEVDHVQEKRVSTQGAIKRITIAVVVDGAPTADGSFVPRPPEELAKIASLVKSAVGADDKRGDVVTIETMPFPSSEVLPAATTAPPFYSALPKPVKRYAPVAAGALAALFAIAIVISKKRKKSKLAAESKDAPQLSGTPELAALPKMAAAPAALENAREEALRRAKTDPATAALVLRRWLGTSNDSKQNDAAA